MTTELDIYRDQINGLLEALRPKYQRLLDEGHSSTYSIQAVCGLFSERYPQLAQTLGEILLARTNKPN